MSILMEVAYWPLWFGCAALAAAALLHLVLDVVPNSLSVLTALSGVAASCMASIGAAAGAGGGLASALLCMFVGGGIGVAFWLREWAPGGTVKMHLAFCGWVGAAIPLWSSLQVTLLVTGVTVAAVAIVLIPAYRVHLRRAQATEPGTQPHQDMAPVQLVASVAAILGLVLASEIGIIP